GRTGGISGRPRSVESRLGAGDQTERARVRDYRRHCPHVPPWPVRARAQPLAKGSQPDRGRAGLSARWRLPRTGGESMKPTKPPNGPEDEPGPVMMTQRRAGALLEALYLDVCRIATRLEALAAHFDHAALRDVHNGIVSDASALSKIRAKVLSGEIPIVLGEDVTSWERRQPLIAAIEANGHGNGHVDPPAKPRKPKRPDTLVKPAVPDDRDPWTAPVSRLIEHGLPDQTLKFVLDCEIMTVGELSAIDDFTPLEFS